MPRDALDLLDRASPFALAALIYLARTYGPRWLRSVNPALLPWASALAGAAWGALGPAGQAEVGATAAALDGALQTGLAAGGAWGLTAAVRKRRPKRAKPLAMAS